MHIEMVFITSTILTFVSMMVPQSNVLNEKHFFYSFPIRNENGLEKSNSFSH